MRFMGHCKIKWLNQAKEGIQKRGNRWKDTEEVRLREKDKI
jgi:hypothetical protein